MVILVLTVKQKQQPSNQLQHQEIWKHMYKIASDKEFSQHFLVKVNFVVEKKPGVTDVRLLDRQPAEKHIIFTWEQVRRFTVFDNQ